MITKTERLDLKLKGCAVGPDNEIHDADGEIVDLNLMLKAIFGLTEFDLSAASVSKEELEVETDD